MAEKQHSDLSGTELHEPKSHGLDSHTSCVLVDLNADISDATLIDTGDSRLSDARTPTAHNQSATTITTGTLAIARGGTGESTAQAAIDALSQVSGATNEYVLTKDTGTGNAKWKVSVGGGGSSTWVGLTDTAVSITSLQLVRGNSGGTALEQIAQSTLLLDNFGTPENNTDLDATTGHHGLLPKLGGGTDNYLCADGTWTAPSGGSGATAWIGLTDTVATIEADKLVIANGAGTQLGFVNPNTLDVSKVDGCDAGVSTGSVFKIPASLARGDIFFVNVSKNLTRLPAGTSGHFLKTQYTSGDPVWEALPSGGATAWTGLTDTVAAIEADKLVVANGAGTQLGFLAQSTFATASHTHDGRYYTETEINTWRNSTTQTEMGYVHGVTSDIQIQLNGKAVTTSVVLRNGANSLTGNWNPDGNGTRKIGDATHKLAELWAVDGIFGDLVFEERECHICGEPFDEGEILSLVVVNTAENGTHTVPVHSSCIGGDN